MARSEVTIRRYEDKDEDRLFALIEGEGDEWSDYWRGAGRAKYQNALTHCINYLLFEGKELCGYVRCRDDDGFGIYIYDLLVSKEHRGKDYGRLLMEKVCRDFPDQTVYVMSDVDAYYEKLGYEREGSILVVQINSK